MSEIKKIPYDQSRIETGVVQFGNDWPGVFIRGDEALGLASDIKIVLKSNDPLLMSKMLEIVAEMLRSCRVQN